MFAFSINVVNMPLLLDGNAICKQYLSQITTVNKIFSDYSIFPSCYLQGYFAKNDNFLTAAQYKILSLSETTESIIFFCSRVSAQIFSNVISLGVARYINSDVCNNLSISALHCMTFIIRKPKI